MFQRRRDLDADDIGPRRQHLAQLDVSGAQPFQRRGQPRRRHRACAGTKRAAPDPPAQSRPAAAAENLPMCSSNKCAHQSRQAECMAAMPPERLRTFTWPRPASRDHVRRISPAAESGGCFRRDSDRTSASCATIAADLGQQLEGIGIVERIQPRHLDLGKFQAKETPARLQHPARFAQRLVDMRHIADAEGDGIGVEAGIGERQGLGIAADPFDGALAFFFARGARLRPASAG